MHSTPQMRMKPKAVRGSLLAFFALSIVLSGTYFITGHFAGVSIVLSQKQQSTKLEQKAFTLAKGADSPINFEVMIVPGKETRDITLTETKTLPEKVSGDITLYNEFSTKAVAISAGSFVSDDTGKAYKTDRAVTIPGYKLVGGKVVAGQAMMSITSFLPGDAYNSENTNSTHFSISAYKGTTKYKKIYGLMRRPISGGAMGLSYVVGSDPKALANIDIIKADHSFRDNLMKKVEVPPGYLLYPDATTFTSDIDSNILSPTASAKIAINSTLSAVIIKESDLSRFIIKSAIPDITDKELSEIKLNNLNNLKFRFTNTSQAITKDMQSVDFTLDGEVALLWQPDIDKLKMDLAGAQKGTVQSIFHTDPGIANATVKFFPPWLSYIPNDISKINITTK